MFIQKLKNVYNIAIFWKMCFKKCVMKKEFVFKKKKLYKFSKFL